MERYSRRTVNGGFRRPRRLHHASPTCPRPPSQHITTCATCQSVFADLDPMCARRSPTGCWERTARFGVPERSCCICDLTASTLTAVLRASAVMPLARSRSAIERGESSPGRFSAPACLAPCRPSWMPRSHRKCTHACRHGPFRPIHSGLGVARTTAHLTTWGPGVSPGAAARVEERAAFEELASVAVQEQADVLPQSSEMDALHCVGTSRGDLPGASLSRTPAHLAVSAVVAEHCDEIGVPFSLGNVVDVVHGDLGLPATIASLSPSMPHHLLKQNRHPTRGTSRHSAHA